MRPVKKNVPIGKDRAIKWSLFFMLLLATIIFFLFLYNKSPEKLNKIKSFKLKEAFTKPALPDTVEKEENNILPPDKVITDTLTVVKDYMMSKRQITLYDYISPEDSLIPANIYIIEFWRSPVNYMGYRFNRNKIQLFGVSDTLDYRFIRSSDSLILFNNLDNYWLIERSPSFSSFNILDEELIRQQYVFTKDSIDYQ